MAGLLDATTGTESLGMRSMQNADAERLGRSRVSSLVVQAEQALYKN